MNICPIEKICLQKITKSCKKCPIEYHPNARAEQYVSTNNKMTDKIRSRDRMIYLRFKSYGWKKEWLMEEYGMSRQNINRIIREQDKLPGKVITSVD